MRNRLKHNNIVSILGMLEGVLKEKQMKTTTKNYKCFNPWYVGGGVKSQVLP